MSANGFVVLALLQTVALCAVVVSLCDLCARIFRLCDQVLVLCAAVLALGVMGYLAFWLAWASYPAFRVVKIVVLAALLGHCALIAWRRRLGAYRFALEPLLFTSLFCIVVITLGLSGGGIADPTSAALDRFSHLLPRDNEIPWYVANALRQGKVPSPLFGDWLMSDRPPLQTGLYLLLVLRSGAAGYQIVASQLQATFLLGVWAIVAAAGLAAAPRRLVLLACCLLPVALINTFFVWPKMLAAGYLLGVFALLFCRKPASADEERATGILIGGLTAFSMLSHGASAFALIGFAVTVLLFWAWPTLRTMLYGAPVLLALYLPWMLYQRFIDPPANRLLKWHLAGVVDVDSRSIGEALRDSYGALSWQEYLRIRVINLETMVGPWPASLRDLLTAAAQPELLRQLDFFHLLPSLHGFSIALLAAILLLPFAPSAERRVALRLLVAIAATLATFALLSFIPALTVNHAGTYATPLLITVLTFVILSSRAPWLACLFVALQAVTMAWLYAFSLAHTSMLMLAICAAAASGLLGYTLAPLFLSPHPEELTSALAEVSVSKGEGGH